MTWLLGIVNLVLLLLAGVAEPAPRDVGPVELAMVAIAGLTMVVVIAAMLRSRPEPLGGQPAHALAALAAYAVPFIVSVVVSAVNGIGFAEGIRSAIPYLAYLPIALLGLFATGHRRMTFAAGGLLVAGVLHGTFLLFLYLRASADLTSPEAILLARTTWLDPRTTLPLVLAAGLLPLATVVRGHGVLKPGLAILISAIATLAAASTQTRSQIVALLAGFGTFFVLYTVLAVRRRGASLAVTIRRTMLAGGLGAVLLVGLGFATPQVRALAGAIQERTRQDQDTGRIADEWAPALSTVVDGGLPAVLFGVGAGGGFVTLGGDERTYVHNILIYAVLYQGVIGAGILLLFYAYLIASLARRGFAEEDPRYLALAALVVALFTYAQFFAVHKLLGYNLMLMIACQTLLFPVKGQPRKPAV
jgi:hypothetical protein